MATNDRENIHTHRKVERTPAQLAELKEVRERFSRERPTMDRLLATGESDGPFRHGCVLDFLGFLGMLRDARLARGMSLAELSKRSGIDQPALSRIEGGKNLNPTVGTLWTVAEALGVRIVWAIEPLPER